jgi:hypothetical protein
MLYACYPITWTIAGTGQVGIFFYARRRIRRRAESGTWTSEIPEAELPENEPSAVE